MAYHEGPRSENREEQREAASHGQESLTPEERFAQLKAENPNINLDSPFGYGVIGDHDGMAMYLGYAKNAAEEKAMNEAFALGRESGRQDKQEDNSTKRETPEAESAGVESPHRETPEQEFERLIAEHPFDERALETSRDYGIAGDQSAFEEYLKYYAIPSQQALFRRAFAIGQEQQATHPETTKGAAESTSELSPVPNEQKKAAAHEKLARFRAEFNALLHPNVIDKVFEFGANGDTVAMEDYLDKWSNFFDTEQKAKLIEAYNIGAEMSEYQPLSPESAPDRPPTPTEDIQIHEPVLAHIESPPPPLAGPEAEFEILLAESDAEMRDFLTRIFEATRQGDIDTANRVYLGGPAGEEYSQKGNSAYELGAAAREAALTEPTHVQEPELEFSLIFPDRERRSLHPTQEESAPHDAIMELGAKYRGNRQMQWDITTMYGAGRDTDPIDSDRTDRAVEKLLQGKSEEERRDLERAYIIGSTQASREDIRDVFEKLYRESGLGETAPALAEETPSALEEKISALDQIQQRLAGARTAYARLAVAEDARNKNRPKERAETSEGQPKIRMNLLREDLTPIEGLEEARMEYFAVVRDLRALRAEQVREELAAMGITADAPLFKRQQKEIRRRTDALLEETVLREGVALYDEKTRLRLAPERGFLHPDEAWKLLQRWSEWYNRLDAYHRDPTKGRFHWSNLPRNKIMISAGLFAGATAAGFYGLTAGGVIMGGGKLLQRILSSTAMAVGTEGAMAGAMQFLDKKLELRGMGGAREDFGNLAENLDAILDRQNDLLDARLQTFEKQQGSFEQQAVKYAGRALGIGMGVLVGSGTAARFVREGAVELAELTGFNPAAIAEKIGISKDKIAKLIPRGVRSAEAQPLNASKAVSAGAGAPNGRGFWKDMKTVMRGNIGIYDKEPEAAPAPTKPDIRQTTGSGKEGGLQGTSPAPRISPEVRRAINTDLADQKAWRENMQTQGISEEAIKDSMRHQLQKSGQYQDTDAGRREMKRRIENTWTTKARDILKDPDLARQYAMYSENLREYNESQRARTGGTEASPETKLDTTPSKTPPQQTKPIQSGGREEWDPTQKKWIPAKSAAVEQSSAPAGEGRSPYTPPAEGAKTAPPRTAAAEAPPKTQAGSESQYTNTLAEIARERTNVALKMGELKKIIEQYDQEAVKKTDPTIKKKLTTEAAKLRIQYTQLEQEIKKIDAARGDAQPAKTGAPKTAAEVVARARDAEMTTVRKGEGAWQTVRRQFYERMRTSPQKFGMTAEDVAKLPEDIDKLGKGTKAAKLLNRETLATLKKAGFINEDGSTKLGIRKEGVQVLLQPDNSIIYGDPNDPAGNRGKSIYEFHKQKSEGAQPTDEVRRTRGRATNRALPERGPATRQSFDLNKEPPLPELKARLEDADSYGGRAAADKIESANLKEFDLKPQELKNISEMKTKAFMDEMDRHDAEIREAARSRARRSESIFINRGPFTTRGFSADMTEAQKYLDLSLRLEKYLKPLDKASRQAILKEPVGKILRAFSFGK